jgi:hypothetical protein
MVLATTTRTGGTRMATRDDDVCFTITVKFGFEEVQAEVSISRAEWDSMSWEERRETVADMVRDEIANHVDGYAEFDDPGDDPQLHP